MIKIVVAEDQILIQKDICKKIEKTLKNVEIAATALNGEDAYQKILDLRPDILITDIRMPIKSGLELIRQLKEEHLSVKTVILSGYKDFEYAKEAIKLGVDEYLLKPVSVEDLKYILDTLEEKILCERTSSLDKALHTMLTAGTPFPHELQNDLHFSSYHLMLLTLNSCATFSFQDWLPYENELEELLKGPVVNKYLKKGDRVFIYNGNTYNQKILMFCSNRTSSEKLDMMAAELIREIEKLTQSVTLSVSAAVSSINTLNLEYKLMKNQLINQLIFSRSSILHSHDFLATAQPTSIDLEARVIDSFYFCMRTQNLEAILSMLSGFFKTCEQKNATQKYISICLKKLLHICFAGTEDINLANRELEIDEYLSNSKTYEELRLSIQLLFEQLFRKHILKQGGAPNPEELIESVKKYIRSNYGKDININDIAVHFFITPAYLSRLFKKYSDVRPIEYLTNYRIQKACDYFSHSHLTVREVAELCGYSNQFYFSKAFKQITSVSPSEYRIQHQPAP